MNKYCIQWKISTLANCALFDGVGNPKPLEIEGLTISHWDFNHQEGWLKDAWLAESVIEADDYGSAFQIFNKKMISIIPKVSLISQTYTQYHLEPFLIHKVGSDKAFFRYTYDDGAVGLMFLDEGKEALNLLLKNKDIPQEFYFYWIDAVNTVGYSSKLLIMLSALEALAKGRNKKIFATPRALTEKILGKELNDEIFEKGLGLRNRLAHGEYLSDKDSQKDYVNIIHNKVMHYFNESVLGKDLISEDILHPHRHPFGNRKESKDFITLVDSGDVFDLKAVIEDFDKNGFRNPQRYSHFYEKNFPSTY